MRRQRKQMLEFLFIGPLFSIFKFLNQLRRDIVGLREDLVAINEQLGKARSEIVSKISDLESACQFRSGNARSCRST